MILDIAFLFGMRSNCRRMKANQIIAVSLSTEPNPNVICSQKREKTFLWRTARRSSRPFWRNIELNIICTVHSGQCTVHSAQWNSEEHYMHSAQWNSEEHKMQTAHIYIMICQPRLTGTTSCNRETLKNRNLTRTDNFSGRPNIEPEYKIQSAHIFFILDLKMIFGT